MKMTERDKEFVRQQVKEIVDVIIKLIDEVKKLTNKKEK